ncbi:MAG: hypothetical protein J2P25_00955 [Nocardiopsaceae bacterium]|nr:hypothetical protein [Nocardiopsaceae bacterium]
MGGGWDSMAGELVVAVGGSRNLNYIEKFDRSLTWIRTSARVVIMHDSPDHDGRLVTEYEAGQVGIRPDWQPGERSQRVDVAFADGSWIGFRAKSRVPGGAEDHAVRDLLAELAGPPVTATVLPPLGRE